MCNCDLAYLAGIIDGEGTITIHKHPQHRRATFQLRPRLTVANTFRPLLEAIQRRHGGTIISNGARQSHHKESYLWRVCGRADLLSLLEGVRPHLIVKASQADAMLTYLRSRTEARADNRNASYTTIELAAFEAIRAMNRGAIHQWRA